MPVAPPDADSPIRVLRVITRLNIGGPSIQAITLSDRLTARGFETRLVHGRLDEGEGDMRYLLPPGVDARLLTSLQRPLAPAHDAVALARVLDIIRDFRPHIMHTHMAKAGTVARAAAAIYNRTAGRDRALRVVHTYHGHVLEGYFSPAKTRLFLGIERGLAGVTDRIVAISPRIREQLLGDYHIGVEEQYAVIPLGFDLSALAAVDDDARARARSALGVAPSDRVITTVGRLTAIKQHGLFLDVAARVAARNERATFLIVGDGELRAALEAHARALGIDARVRFLGWRRDLATVYGASDLFLLTSRNEGTPVALIESLAAGVSAVSTDVGGVRDVVGDNLVALLAPDGDADTLASHVITMIADDARRRRMGEMGRARALERYGLDRLTDDVEALYRRLLT
jgi:glycosyltransferase involved in cell wall biosynthesis